MSSINNVTTYIPQREPIVMISELCSATELEALTKLHISDKNIFCKDGVFQESGLVENIAQTAAALSGYNAHKNNATVKKGFIGSVSNLTINKLPIVGQTIETTVIIETEVMNVHIIKGSVKLEDEIIAECNMKIFIEE